MGRVLESETYVIDLSGTTYATYADVAELLPMAGKVADYFLAHIEIASSGGGTGTKVRIVMKDQSGGTVVGTPLSLWEADDLAAFGSEFTAAGDVVAMIGASFAGQAFGIPPYCALQVEEDKTSGTLTITIFKMSNDN